MRKHFCSEVPTDLLFQPLLDQFDELDLIGVETEIFDLTGDIILIPRKPFDCFVVGAFHRFDCLCDFRSDFLLLFGDFFEQAGKFVGLALCMGRHASFAVLSEAIGSIFFAAGGNANDDCFVEFGTCDFFFEKLVTGLCLLHFYSDLL